MFCPTPDNDCDKERRDDVVPEEAADLGGAVLDVTDLEDALLDARCEAEEVPEGADERQVEPEEDRRDDVPEAPVALRAAPEEELRAADDVLRLGDDVLRPAEALRRRGADDEPAPLDPDEVFLLR